MTMQTNLEALINRANADKKPFSHFQMAIFDWVMAGEGNAIVEAVAGASKTTMLKAIAELVFPQRAVVLAFNRHVMQEISGKLPNNAEALTTHQYGRRAIVSKFPLHKDSLDPDKYKRLIDEALQELGFARYGEESRAAFKALKSMVEMCRLTRTPSSDADAVYDMCLEQDIETEFFETLFPSVYGILDRGLRMVTDPEPGHIRYIDYTDMLWFPLVYRDAEGRSLPFEKWPWVLGDESQDWNRAQQELVQKAVSRNNGRAILVGDSRQAIMGFAGADTRSMERLQEMFDATVLPLSICYRCPVNHIKEAQRIVPHIEPHPSAGAGIIERHLDEDHLISRAEPGDLVICRRTAPVVRCAFGFIRAGKRAIVRGRNIGDGLVSVVKKVEKRHGPQMDGFASELLAWQYAEIQKLEALRESKPTQAENQIQALEDRVATILCIADSTKPATVEKLKGEITKLFDDDTPSDRLIVCSTVHRAKGLEARRVWVVAPQYLGPSKRDKSPEAIQQSMNLWYVAITRSRNFMGYIETEDAA